MKKQLHFNGRMIAAATAITLGMIANPAMAHHSFALFDKAKELKLTGQVKDFQWTNPHIWIQLLVPDTKGGQTEWAIEGASLNSLVRSGWKRTSVKVGDTVDVVVNPARDGSNDASLVSVSVNGQIVGKK